MTMPETTQSDLVAKLKALDSAATAGDLSTAERHIAEEHIECPVCQGEGEVLAADYCNIDGKALGVQFYGIGGEFGAHEALWTFLRNSVPEIIAMAEDAARLRARCEARQETIRRAEIGVTTARSFLVIDETSHAERHLADVVQLLVAYRGENANG